MAHGSSKGWAAEHVPQEVWNTVQTHLAQQGIQTTPFHYYHPKKKQSYRGLRIHTANINDTSSFGALLDSITDISKAGVALTFSENFDKAISLNNNDSES